MSFIRKLDMISPPITLYFKGEDQHSSIFSGILSIIIGLLILAATIYYFLGFINKDNPKSYFLPDILKMLEIFLLILHRYLIIFNS